MSIDLTFQIFSFKVELDDLLGHFQFSESMIHMKTQDKSILWETITLKNRHEGLKTWVKLRFLTRDT